VKEYPLEEIFIYLSRNSSKHVYMETDSEKVLLDLRTVQQSLRSGNEAWIMDMKRWKESESEEDPTTFPVFMGYGAFKDTLLQHLEETKMQYNSTQNGFLASPYAVRMMCRFVDFGDYFFTGPYASIKGFRGLIDGHCAGVSWEKREGGSNGI
jgi:hypothetical protein